MLTLDDKHWITSHFDQRFDGQRREFMVLHERIQEQIKIMGDGFAGLNEKLDRHIADSHREHEEIKTSFTPTSMHLSLAKRVDVLEGK